MSARSKARKRALDILYRSLLLEEPLAKTYAAAAEVAATEPERASSWEYTSEIITGLISSVDQIDELISDNLDNWSIHRLAVVDLAILRLSVWELKYSDKIPAAVAINEAVELAKIYSTEKSAAFINGVLSGVLAKADNQNE